MARRNACLDAAIKELQDRGIDYEVVRLKKHMAVRWAVIAHRPRTLTVPSDAACGARHLILGRLFAEC
jgi:hypothetical protein